MSPPGIFPGVSSIGFVIFGCLNFQLLSLYSAGALVATLCSDPAALLPQNLVLPQQCGRIQASPEAIEMLVLCAAAFFVYGMMACHRRCARRVLA